MAKSINHSKGIAGVFLLLLPVNEFAKVTLKGATEGSTFGVTSLEYDGKLPADVFGVPVDLGRG